MTFLVTPPTVTGGTVVATSPPSTKVKAGGSFIYDGPLTITIAGWTDTTTGAVQTAPVPAVIVPTAIKTKADSQFVIREKDKVNGVVIAALIGMNPTTFTMNVEIISAGQTKVKAG